MNIVKALRKKADLQQQELADMVGVARPTVSEWENQKKDPSGERLHKLAEIFKVDELVILGVVPAVPASELSPSQKETGLNEFLIELLMNASEDRRKTILEFLQLPDEQQLRVVGYLEALKTMNKG